MSLSRRTQAPSGDPLARVMEGWFPTALIIHSFIFGLIGGCIVLSSEFIFSWDSENQWLLLMLFKYSHLECCPVSPNKSCFCARRSRQYFPRIQKQRVCCILTEQISDYIGFSAQEWFYNEVLSLISAKAPSQNFTFMNNKWNNNHDVLYNGLKGKKQHLYISRNL